MGAVTEALFTTTVGKALFFVLIVIVGFYIRGRIDSSFYGYRSTRRENPRRGDTERHQKEIKRKYSYLDGNSSNKSKGTKVVTALKRLIKYGSK